MRLNVVLIILVYVIEIIDGAKILFFCPIPAHSHQKLYKELWRTLSLKGHKMFVVTPNPVFNASMTNLTEYDISSMYEFQNNQIRPEWKEGVFRKPTFLGTIIRQFILQWIAGNGMELLYQHKEVERLLTEHNHFDVCVIEWFHPAPAIYGHLFQCPTIGIGSNSLPTQMLDAVGNPIRPIAAPDQDLPIFRDQITFFQRVWSTFWSIFVRLHSKYLLLPNEDARIRKYYGDNIPYLGNLVNNVSLLIVNRNTVFHRPIANMPNVIEVGSVKYTKTEAKISSDLKDFLDSSKQGVIYFSLGVTMDGTSMPLEYVQKIQNTFSKLPYNILWKWENSTMPSKPKNVFISKFMPQTYILEHSNVKLFITQGGLQSTEEAIAAHKPIIGIPFHSDQTTNVDTCVKYGMGKMLDLEDLTEDTLRTYILEVIKNPSYSENARKLDELMKDQPQDGLDKAIWWIEYVIRHKGARHLRSIAVDLPWWQYLMLDVFGFILAIILTIFSLVYLIFKLLRAIIFLTLRKDNSRRNARKKNE